MNSRARRPRQAIVWLILCAGLALGAAGSAFAAAGKEVTVQDLQQMAQTSMDTSLARETADRLKDYLASKPDSNFVPFAHMVLVQALMTCKAPIKELLAEIARSEAILPDRADAKTSFYCNLAVHLSERGEALEQATGYATKALALCPRDEQYRPLRSIARGALGNLQLKGGRTAEAIASLNLAMSDSPDSQTVLLHLGQAYEKAGKPDAAIGAYVRSLGVFSGDDTSAAVPLQALWRKRHGSLEGMAARIAAAERSSLNKVALEKHRHEMPAPGWSLPDLEGKTVQFASLKGKVIVMDFWGSWCGPCRTELPYFQALYDRFKGHPNVVFISMNWERAASAEEHARTAKEFMAKNHYTFPVVYDHDRIAVEGYKIEGFPTLFLIDRTGKVRYRNVGFDPGIGEIVTAQIQSLLE